MFRPFSVTIFRVYTNKDYNKELYVVNLPKIRINKIL